MHKKKCNCKAEKKVNNILRNNNIKQKQRNNIDITLLKIFKLILQCLIILISIILLIPITAYLLLNRNKKPITLRLPIQKYLKNVRKQ